MLTVEYRTACNVYICLTLLVVVFQ